MLNLNNDRLIDLDNDFTEEEEKVFEIEPTGIQDSHGKTNADSDSDSDLGSCLGSSSSSDLESTIVKKYRGGMSVSNIVKESGVSWGKVYEILARHHVPLRQGRSRSKSNDRISTMSQSEKEALIDDYKKGVSIKDLFKKYDINKHGVYILLDEANVPRRKDIQFGVKKEKSEMMVQGDPNHKVGKNTNRNTSMKGTTPVVEMSKKGDTLYIKVPPSIKMVKVDFGKERLPWTEI